MSNPFNPIIQLRKEKVIQETLKAHIRQQAATIKALDEIVNGLYAEKTLLEPIAVSVLNLVSTIDTSEADGNYWRVTGELGYLDLIDKIQTWQVTIHNKKD